MAQRTIFISYAHENRPEVEPSAELLRAGGVQVFIDVAGIAYGDRWQDTLRQALDQCERVLVFWSLAAKASEWVEREWRYALQLGKRLLFCAVGAGAWMRRGKRVSKRAEAAEYVARVFGAGGSARSCSPFYMGQYSFLSGTRRCVSWSHSS